MEFFDAIHPWLIGAVGGFLGAAMLLPTKLGEAIIQYRVGRTLETFRTTHAKELENLRATLGHLADRGKHSNEMEFQAIETVWKAFVKAWLSTNTCIAQMMKVPEFSRMGDDEIRSFVFTSHLSDDEKELLLKARDKDKQYVSILDWKSTMEARSDIYAARLVLREQRIFMPPDITKQFNDVIEQMSGAQVEKQLSLEHPHIRDYVLGKAQTDWLKSNTAVFETLATSANRRLFRDERHVPETNR